MSQRNLELSLMLKMVDRITNPARRVTGVTGKLAKGLSHTRQAISNLSQQSKKVAYLQQLQGRLGETASKTKAASRKLAYLRRQMQIAGPKAGKVLRKDLAKSIKNLARLSKQQVDLQTKIKATTTAMRKEGIATENLGNAQERMAAKTERLNRKLQRQEMLLSLSARAGNKMRTGLAKMKSAALWGSGAALTGGLAVGLPMLNTAAEFENYLATLKTIEGSQIKAKKSMDWISTFANKTPYKMGAVTESFVRLRSYGLNPTNGLLKTLGDTSAAMNKPIMQAVEAIADAVTGENERLKEFGIKARAEGDLFTYEFTDKKGVQRELSALKNNRKAIEKVLRRIWDEKYTGAMEDRMTTWGGLMSNMSDKWTRFQLLIMESGPLNRLKDNLTGVLEKFDTMEKSGTLQQWAETIGQKIALAIDKLTAFGTKVWDVIQVLHKTVAPFAQFVGGWDKLALVLLSLKLFPVITTLGLLLQGVLKLTGGISGLVSGFKGTAKALAWLGRLALAHPLVALITAIGSIYLAVKNWEKIKGVISGVLDWIVSIMPNWMKSLLGIDDKGTSTAEAVNKSQSISTPKKAMAVAAVTAGLAASNAIAAPVVTPAGHSTSSVTYQVEINIHTQPGDDKQAIAEQIRDELEQLRREEQSRRRVTLYDY